MGVGIAGFAQHAQAEGDDHRADWHVGQENQRQEAYWVSSAPSVGPVTAAAPMEPQVPMATGRRAGGNSGRIRGE